MTVKRDLFSMLVLTALALFAWLIFALAGRAQTPAAAPAPATLQVTGLVMPYTDDAGVVYPAAFWLPAQVTIDTVDVRGSVSWYAYKDAAALAAHRATIAQHQTQADAPTFLAASQQPPQGATMAQVVANIAIGMGMAVKDTDSGAKDPDGKPIMRPFFVGAVPTAVSVPLPAPGG